MWQAREKNYVLLRSAAWYHSHYVTVSLYYSTNSVLLPKDQLVHSKNASQREWYRLMIPAGWPWLVLHAQAGRETFTDKLQFDVVSTDKQARLIVVGCVLIDHAAVRFERLVQPSFSHRSDRGRRDACVTTWQTKICLHHGITCLSRYFAQSVCMGLYGVRYSLYIYTLGHSKSTKPIDPVIVALKALSIPL